MVKEKKAVEAKDSTKTVKNESKKEQLKKAKQLEKVAMMKEKERLEKEIDALKKKLKEAKEKSEKKSIKEEIEELKYQRSQIGKRDTFLRDVKKEMRLVRWPKGKEIVKYSIACLTFVVFFALFYLAIDGLFILVKELIG